MLVMILKSLFHLKEHKNILFPTWFSHKIIMFGILHLGQSIQALYIY